MAQDGPFVVCHVKLNCYRVEVVPAVGRGCPKCVPQYVIDLLTAHGFGDRQSAFFRPEDAHAAADWLNRGLSNGIVDAAQIRGQS